MVDLVYLTKRKDKEYSTVFINDLIDNVAYFISSIINKVKKSSKKKLIIQTFQYVKN